MPAMVAMFDGAVQIATGRYHSCALRNNHSVWCWGSDTEGQLGDGAMTNREFPVRALLP
jgi:alpha-tubulin suppressor-like RCC1 family protein